MKKESHVLYRLRSKKLQQNGQNLSGFLSDNTHDEEVLNEAMECYNEDETAK